ncbi:MAG: SLC13 family permease, partial [Candidatus Hodarchaeota archaeon]
MNLPAIIFVLILFGILMAFYSQDKLDHFPVALLVGVIGVVGMLSFGGLDEAAIIVSINFNTLIFIFSMQIIIFFATNDRVLEYIAINIIHMTKGNNRLFFYVICLFTAILVAFIEDVTLSLILVPLIYRTCRALDIPAGTYMMGMTISINIGAILTPISSLKNLIIGQEFSWGFGQYFANMGILFLVTLLCTLFLFDRFILKKEEKPTEDRKKVLLKLLEPEIVIVNKKHFFMTFAVFIATFVFMIIGFEPVLVVVISAAVLLILHWKKCTFSDLYKEIEWKIIITFAILFIFSNSLEVF